MANIKFYLSEKAPIRDMCSVLVRFYSGKQTNQQTDSGVRVPVSVWNATDGRCIISKRYETPINIEARAAQNKLDALADFIFQEYNKSVAPLPPKWLKNVVRSFHQPQQSEKDPSLADIIEPYCRARNIAPPTRLIMLGLQKHLRAYPVELRASSLSKSQIEGFYYFLLHDRNLARNSAIGRIKQLRTLLYWYGKPHPNPFDSYKIPADVYGSPIYLTKEELQYLYAYNDFTAAKIIQRDIFVFHCLIGCRVSDLYSLTAANITKDGTLVYVPKKTSRAIASTIEVPLSPTATEIIKRYENADPLHLLPFISVQKYNENIRAILKAACIDRPVMVLDPHTFETRPRPLYEVASSHTARKTFAQILYTTTTDRRLVASLTGHSENSRAFNRYSEINKDMKTTAIKNAIF